MTERFESRYYNQKEIWENYGNKTEMDRAKKTIDLIPKDVKSVLDIGCGNGIVTNMIQSPFVVGLDLGRSPLNHVKKHTVQASLDALPIKNQKFDLIILTEVLEHLDNESFIKAIKELNRLNAKYYLITVPFKEQLDFNLCKCDACGNLFNQFHHYRRFDDAWFIKEFKDYSLEKEQYARYVWIANEKITRLRHSFNIYQHSDYAICNKCGHPSDRPKPTLIRYMFKGFIIADYYFKELLNIRRPYYQMVLLKRRGE